MVKRALAGLLSLVYFLSNVAFLHAAEVNFWKERQKSIHKTEDRPSQLASLPASMLGQDLNNSQNLLNQFPSLNKTLNSISSSQTNPILAKLPPSVAPYIEAIPLNNGLVKDLYLNKT